MLEVAMQEHLDSPQRLTPALRVLAQSPSDWAGWVERLSMALAGAVDSAVDGARAARSWRVDLAQVSTSPTEVAPGASRGRTRWVVFVEGPARHLALRLGAEPSASAHEILATWLASATKTLAVVHALRSHCVVFDSDEASVNPAAVAHWLSGWLGEDLPEDGWPVTPPPAGLMAKLAQEFVQADRRAEALWTELLACCSTLPGVPEQSWAPPGASDHHLAQAQALMAATARVPALEAAQQGLREELERTQQRVRELEVLRQQDALVLQEQEGRFAAERARLEQARQSAEACANEARAESELLLVQLHTVQEELESAVLQQHQTGKALETEKQHAQANQSLAQQAQKALAEQTERARSTELQAQEARAEAELLLTQLHQVQEELESLFLQKQEASKLLLSAQTEAKAAQAELAATKQQLQAERQQSAERKTHLDAAHQRVAQAEASQATMAAQLQKANQALAQAREQHQNEKAALEGSLRTEQTAKEQTERARLQAEAEYTKARSALEAQAKELKEEADLLLVQLHHVQEELETHFFALQDARHELAVAKAEADAGKGHIDGLGFRVMARQQEITGHHSEPPHRELDLVLGDLTLGTLKLDRAGVRLLEHEGRAGLALVALAEQPPPITQWAPDGEDGRGAHMLFVPADARGRDRLAALGTRNWQALRGLAALVQLVVSDPSVPDAPLWQAVAGRLCAALDALPPRLRYDEMLVQREGGALMMRLEGASFGGQALPPLALRWAPDRGEAPLTLLRTDPHRPCLAAWPAGPDGLLAAELNLPVANETGLGNRLRWWARLLPADRDLALALVDTLAAAPALLPADADGAQRQRLAAQAAQVRSHLQRSLNLGRWARRLRQGLRGQRT